jgi:hypothetical protein
MIRFNAFIEVLSLSGFYLSYLAVPGTGVGVGLAFTCPSPAGGLGGSPGGGQSTPLTIPNPITTITTFITIIFMFIS